jgi:CheY-like chemotaxis protein
MSTILLVEDDARQRLLGRRVLETHGYTVVLASEGASAVSLATEGDEPALVLMDISLPGVDGLEAARRIRELRPGVPVVALTAHTLDGEHERLLNEWFDGFLRKPFLIADLLDTVARHLRVPAL